MRIFSKAVRVGTGALLAGVLASSLPVVEAFAQSAAQPARGNGTKAAPSATVPSSTSSTPRFHETMPGRAEQYYRLVWGVDSLIVRSVESGELIRFSYRVVDAVKAKALSDKKQEPFLIDERAHAQLVVPSLEKVGQLRQVSNPEVGRSYWMAFSNKGGLVIRGDRVNIVIGNFHANGLGVD